MVWRTFGSPVEKKYLLLFSRIDCKTTTGAFEKIMPRLNKYLIVKIDGGRKGIQGENKGSLPLFRQSGRESRTREKFNELILPAVGRKGKNLPVPPAKTVIMIAASRHFPESPAAFQY
ncbi:MAG: hypothetical protein OSJ58_03535 [Dysosmobacter sp.]|nr:hypothetical protein [Dysosmobacter sp.]